ncbi:MAG: DUF1924 domain-containing protein [Gammaproteobacteria bacterium]|nr:DUF1924 domain-containing protein [Gammaproteobacteria bacterium]
MKSMLFISTLLVLSANTAVSAGEAVNNLINEYQTAAAVKADAAEGTRLWRQLFSAKPPYTKRSCQSCHGTNLLLPGRHVRSQKMIKAMAPSVNTNRLTDTKKITKWLKRNCKWTLGRECTVIEKVNLLAFLRQQ